MCSSSFPYLEERESNHVFSELGCRPSKGLDSMIFSGKSGGVGVHKRILVVLLPQDEIKGLHYSDVVGLGANRLFKEPGEVNR